MKNLRKRIFPLVPVLALLLSLAISAIKARTAAVFTPCEEQQVAQPTAQKKAVKLTRTDQTAKSGLE